ncbi:MAG: pyridoxal-phosphate dependent enzyme [Deltaproteobacteria bacterium]|jgi:threonine dehydratase|nr:pyridoxal-phosphate dependent enzyme [Deltaproteobacteria bacterium]NTV56462.1 pyridoxal-phosphate dependent enzyme [Deltaproteobacteria bacterium]
MKAEPSLEDLREAHQRIEPFIHRTPVLTSGTIDRMAGGEIFFKCENLQKAGAFKIRGACNAVFSLSDDEAKRGVATHSSGNHAAALALAARWRGIPAHVVMPENSPHVKKLAVAGYGAEIVFCKPTLEARERALAEVVARTGANVVHPYNDLRVITGQGTAAIELCEQVQNLDLVVAPVGGGGLLSGTAVAVALVSPKTAVIAAEPERADDAYRSFKSGHIVPSLDPNTIADGLRTSLGDLTFPIIQRYVRDIVLVSEEAIVEAMRCLWERMKILVEPSAAVPLGAILSRRLDVAGRRAGLIVSGGNVDLDRLPWMSKG